MAKKGWEALQKAAGGVGRPSQRAGMGQQALEEVREWSGGPPEGTVGVRRPSWRAGRDREVRKRMGGPTRGLGGVGRPCHRDGKCREVISEVQELSGVPPEGTGGVGRPSRRNGRG